MAKRVESRDQKGGITADTVNIGTQQNKSTETNIDTTTEPKSAANKLYVWLGIIVAVLSILTYLGISLGD